MAEARKTVTVVFADVSDSTELGEQLDPEALRHVIERYFAEARAAVEHHGGTVEKFIGDAVMAVFGIPLVHEDDALRAVRAASDMRERLAGLNAELQREGGVSLAVSTGVNTGEVVAGDPSSGQFYATGDPVNVAARLEQAAAPGEILLGESTYRLVRNAVHAEAVKPLSLKGKAKPVPAYRLGGLVEGASAVVRRFDSPFVGRSKELARLRQAFERVVAERVPVLVTVLGSAGVGKTRLAAELVASLSDRANVLQGHCLSYGEGITFWPLREILRELRGRLEIEGLPDPEQARSTEETFWAYRKLFEGLAAERPLVLLLEDIHWAEPTLLDLVEHIVAWTRDASILVLCLARPELLDERPGWPGEQFLLERLANEETEVLVAALATGLDRHTTARVTEAAEGNPLFLEQMVALALEEDGEGAALPPTIQALLAARLDRLERAERDLLECAAVVGKEFWRGALLELSPPGTEVSALLQRLIRRQLVHPGRSSFPGEDAFRFGHILIRDAAYTVTPKERRAELHERFADWLERSASQYEEIVGYHLEHAFRYRAELGQVAEHEREVARRAADCLTSAGRRAFRRGDMPASVSLLGRATALLPMNDQGRLELLPDLGYALFEVGELERARAVLAEAIERGSATGNRGVEWRAIVKRDHVDMYTHPERVNLEELAGEAGRAVDVLGDLGDDVGLSRAWNLLSDVRWAMGEVAQSAAAAERAADHASRAASSREEAWALGQQAFCLLDGPTPVEEGVRWLERLLHEAAGNPVIEANLSGFLAAHEAMRGRFEAARQRMAPSRALTASLGLKWQVAVHDYLLSARIEALAGDPAAAERHMRAAYDTFSEIGDTWFLASVAVDLPRAIYDQGRYDDAFVLIEAADQLPAPAEMSWQIKHRDVRARLLAQRGQLGEAEALAREAVELAARTDHLDFHGDALIGLAEVLRLADRAEEAVTAVEEALRLYERKGNVVSAGKAQTELAELTRLGERSAAPTGARSRGAAQRRKRRARG